METKDSTLHSKEITTQHAVSNQLDDALSIGLSVVSFQIPFVFI
jgi:hypothetical protein